MKKVSALASIFKNGRDSIKKSTGVSFGFHDPTDWLDTGNYALNHIIAGNFKESIPLGKVVMFAGESGAGKSYIGTANLIKSAQKKGYAVILIDTENALDDVWLTKLGVDTTILEKINLGSVNLLSQYVYNILDNYRTLYDGVPMEERQKLVIIVDSVGMLNTEIANEQMKKGDMKGDLGHKPKQLKAFITNCVNTLGDLGIGMILINHSYESQDMFNPDPKISGGSGMVYASSMVIAMKKMYLKEDESGNKIKEVQGIKAKCKIMKTRYTKPFQEANLYIPYDTGLDPYSGLFDLFLKNKLLVKSGNKYQYTNIDTGEIISKFQKAWNRNDDGCLDIIMDQYDRNPLITSISPSEFGDEMFGNDIDDDDDTIE